MNSMHLDQSPATAFEDDFNVLSASSHFLLIFSRKGTHHLGWALKLNYGGDVFSILVRGGIYTLSILRILELFWRELD